MKLLAVRYDRKGSACRDAGDVDAAIRWYQKAIEQAPNWSVPWYNLGLTHKYTRNWQESYRCNAEAMRLAPTDEAAIWNTGIAATALGNWAEARRAWKSYGLEIEDGEGPIEMNYGSVPIRLHPDDHAEVVWARRIDPARAVLVSIPLPESNHRHGDLVLHDGAPAGYRRAGGREVAVFNELELLASSGEGTFEVTIQAATADDLVSFEETFERLGCATEDWSSIRYLCRECSEGNPHEHPEPEIEGEHRFAIASPSRELVERGLKAWGGRVAGDVDVRIEPMPHH